MVNKKLQCSGQHLLHSDATHRKHVPRRPSTPITPSYPEKRLNYLFLTYFTISEGNVNWQSKENQTARPSQHKCYIFLSHVSLTYSAAMIYKQKASPLEAEHDIQLINNWHCSCAGERSTSISLGYNVDCCAAPPSTVNNTVEQLTGCCINFF